MGCHQAPLVAPAPASESEARQAALCTSKAAFTLSKKSGVSQMKIKSTKKVVPQYLEHYFFYFLLVL